MSISAAYLPGYQLFASFPGYQLVASPASRALLELRRENEEDVMIIAGALWNLSYNNQPNQDAIREAGGVRLLVQLLGAPLHPVQVGSVGAVLLGRPKGEVGLQQQRRLRGDERRRAGDGVRDGVQDPGSGCELVPCLLR